MICFVAHLQAVALMQKAARFDNIWEQKLRKISAEFAEYVVDRFPFLPEQPHSSAEQYGFTNLIMTSYINSLTAQLNRQDTAVYIILTCSTGPSSGCE